MVTLSNSSFSQKAVIPSFLYRKLGIFYSVIIKILGISDLQVSVSTNILIKPITLNAFCFSQKNNQSRNKILLIFLIITIKSKNVVKILL